MKRHQLPLHGNDVVTINYGAIVSENVVDQSFDLFPTGSQDLLKQRVPEKDKDFLFGVGSKFLQ